MRCIVRILDLLGRRDGGARRPAVVLEHQITLRVRGVTGGLSAISTGTVTERVRIAQPLASAFGATFWWTMAMTVVAIVPAFMLRGRRRGALPRPVAVVGAAET